MNPNRQNTCCHPPVGPGVVGRPGNRPPRPVTGAVIGGTPCCSDVIAAQSSTPCCSDVITAQNTTPCCSDVIAAQNSGTCCNNAAVGGIIIGSGAQGCDKETALTGLPLAMAYVPWQSYCNVYPLAQALRNGTVFRELDLEFAGRRCN